MKYLLLLFVLISCAQGPTDHSSLEDGEIKKYVRKDWNHWIDQDRNCLDTRGEILKKRSLGPVEFNKRGCRVIHGKWEDFYHTQIHTTAAQVDIDHVVALKNAHLSGGANWSTRSKEEFANDPENLVITNRAYNRQKGAKGIDQWLPVKKDFACKYVKKWVSVKNQYSLRILPNEQKTIEEIRTECSKLGIVLR
jgi:hypothetical protein